MGTPDLHFVGFLGNVSSSTNNQIAYLKTLTLVRQIGDVPITNEIIVQALRELNEEADDFLELRITAPTTPAESNTVMRMARILPCTS